MGWVMPASGLFHVLLRLTAEHAQLRHSFACFITQSNALSLCSSPLSPAQCSYRLENTLNYCVHSVCIPRVTNSLLLFTVYLHCSYRLENTLNYGMERVWAVGYVKGSNSVAIG